MDKHKGKHKRKNHASEKSKQKPESIIPSGSLLSCDRPKPRHVLPKLVGITAWFLTCTEREERRSGAPSPLASLTCGSGGMARVTLSRTVMTSTSLSRSGKPYTRACSW